MKVILHEYYNIDILIDRYKFNSLYINYSSKPPIGIWCSRMARRGERCENVNIHSLMKYHKVRGWVVT